MFLMQTGTVEDVAKYSKRTIRVSREQTEECRRLLRLMGVPVLDAPSEAEAQCASLCKEGLVRWHADWGGGEHFARTCRLRAHTEEKNKRH